MKTLFQVALLAFLLALTAVGYIAYKTLWVEWVQQYYGEDKLSSSYNDQEPFIQNDETDILKAELERVNALTSKLLSLDIKDLEDIKMQGATMQPLPMSPQGGRSIGLDIKSQEMNKEEFTQWLENKVKQKKALLEKVLMRFPYASKEQIAGSFPVDNIRITSSFGMRFDPFNGYKRMHRGVDFAGKKGDPVKSLAKGEVIFAGRKGAYGLLLEIDHGDGLVTRYAHLNRIHVARQNFVSKGQHIADIGSTGRSTGPHLHLELLENGKPLNPMSYIQPK